MSAQNPPEEGANKPNAANASNDTTVSEGLDDLTKALNSLEVAKNKADEHWNLYLRAMADIENVRRRAKQDVENERNYGIEKFAREILSVADSLEHGLEAVKQGGNADEGLVLTHKLLLDVLQKFGIKQINPLNENFDPKYHEALTSIVNKDVEPNKVLQVVQKGYFLQDRILRPARVVVSRKE